MKLLISLFLVTKLCLAVPVDFGVIMFWLTDFEPVEEIVFDPISVDAKSEYRLSVRSFAADQSRVICNDYGFDSGIVYQVNEYDHKGELLSSNQLNDYLSGTCKWETEYLLISTDEKAASLVITAINAQRSMFAWLLYEAEVKVENNYPVYLPVIGK